MNSALLRPVLLILPILALAAGLRFTPFDQGRGHVPHADEASFVDAASAMISNRDLDHRFYEYPGLFLYLLLPAQAAAGGDGPAAYNAARVVTALFGVLSVGAVSLLGWRLAGPWVGLGAALFLAVSPLEVQVAHNVRPDTALAAFALLALLAFVSIGSRLRGDALAGGAFAAATSIKFTGLLLLPSYLISRVLAPGPRLRGVLTAGAVALATGLLFTPYAVIHHEAFFDGASYQLSYHDRARTIAYGDTAFFYLDAIVRALGVGASLLAALGLVLVSRRLRSWGPIVAYPLVTIGVLASADIHYERHVLPFLGVVALFAGEALRRIAGASPRLAMTLTLAAAVVPLRDSVQFVYWRTQPSAVAKAVEWIESNAAPGTRILDSRPWAHRHERNRSVLGVDPRRYELLQLRANDPRWRSLRLLATHADLVVTGPGPGNAWQAPLETLFEASGPRGGSVFRIRAPRPELRPRYVPLDLSRVQLDSSDNPEQLSLLYDGDSSTAWRTQGPLLGTEWIEMRFEQPLVIGRLEFHLGNQPAAYGPDPQLLGSADGSSFEPAEAVQGRPPVAEQIEHDRPLSQVLLVRPRPVRALRVVQTGRRAEPWAISELSVGVRADGGER